MNQCFKKCYIFFTDFGGILTAYKTECTKTQMPHFVERNFVHKSSNQLVDNIETILQDNDAILISGEAGLGKTYSAKDLRYKWSTETIFKNMKMLFIDSKKVNKEMYKPSYAAPICVSELGETLRDNTDEYLASFGCVKKAIKDLIVVVDGVDELSINNYLDSHKNLKKLQIKIDKNEEISGLETICSEIYEKVKEVEFIKIPSHLVSLIKAYRSLSDDSIGKITKTRLFLYSIFNLLKHHTTVISKDVKTFKKLLEINDTRAFADGIRSIAEMSFHSLLKQNVTIQVEEYKESDTIYFKYNNISIERDVLEKLDLFYIREYDYSFVLEPHNLTSMEYLAACFILCLSDEWNLLLYPDLSYDRILIILPFLAGLHSNDHFTKDFVSHVLLDKSNRNVHDFFNWLYSIEDVWGSLPKSTWYGLRGDGRLLPSFQLLQQIKNEVDVNDEISNKMKDVETIICQCHDFDWYDMDKFNHTFLTHTEIKYNIDTFLNHFVNYNFIIHGEIEIDNIEHFKIFMKMSFNDRITFRLNSLTIVNKLTNITNNARLKVNILSVMNYDSRTVDILLDAISPTSTTSSTSSSITVKLLFISPMQNFNEFQTKKLFKLCLNGVDTLGLNNFLTSKQISILNNIEHRHQQRINFRLWDIDFDNMLSLPNLSERHISLYNNKITDDNLIDLKNHLVNKHRHCNNLSKYKIISKNIPFIRKKDVITACNNQSFYLHLCDVNFDDVSPNIFAETFAHIPSFECEDTSIPSTCWESLAHINDCFINEFRIWFPTLYDLEHYLKIKTQKLQLVNYRKDMFVDVLSYIADHGDDLNKAVKVFAVKCDFNNYDNDYEKKDIFTNKTFDELKNNFNELTSLLNDTEFDSYCEGSRKWKYWCCEINDQNKDQYSVASSSGDDYKDSPRRNSRLQQLKRFFKRR